MTNLLAISPSLVLLPLLFDLCATSHDLLNSFCKQLFVVGI